MSHRKDARLIWVTSQAMIALMFLVYDTHEVLYRVILVFKNIRDTQIDIKVVNQCFIT